MSSYQESKNYHYTLYNSYGKPTLAPPRPSYEPLAQQVKNVSRSGHFTTIHTDNYPKGSRHSPEDVYQEPITKEAPYKPSPPVVRDYSPTEKPLTFPYKNPECGISISGKSGFEIKGDHATIKLEKVLNSRNGGKSGTLRLHLIRMPYFYDGGDGIKPEQYTTVCTANLGQLDGGWSFNDVIRGGMKRTDDSQQYSYRKCYVLLLEQYSQGHFKIVDYMNFD